MPEIGLLSGSAEEKEYGYAPRSRVYAGPDWGWQTQESYDKIVADRNTGFGSEAVDFIEEKAGQVLNLVSQIPGVKGGFQVAGGVVRFIDQTAIQPAIQAAEDPSQIGTPQALIGTVLKTGQLAEQGGASVARDMGVDPRIGSFVGGTAYETVTGSAAGKAGKALDSLTPPPGGGLALAGAGDGLVTRGGQVRLNSNVNQLTVDKPEFIASGVKEGIAQTPEFAGQLTRMQKRWGGADSRLKRWLESFDDPRQAKNIKKSRDNLYGEASTGPSRIENIKDEKYYKTMPALGKERHHLFPKAESYIIVKRMQELIESGKADYDDLVNLFLYAEDAGTVMGNRKANMLLMEKMTEHGPHHRFRETTEGAFGMVKEPANLQELADVFNTANNANELMGLFDQYIIKNIKPSKRDAFARTMKEKRNLLTTLSEQQRRRL